MYNLIKIFLEYLPLKIKSNFRISFFSLLINSKFNAKKVVIQRFVKLRNSTVEDYSYIGYSSNINNTQIGRFCSISANVNIGLPTHPIDYISTSPLFNNINNALKVTWVKHNSYDPRPKLTIIENDVWIGINSTIIGGVKIGNGAIIAAHSLVTKDVPDYAIVGGVPAKLIKYRFQEEVINQLLKSQWWNKSESFLQNSNLLNLFSQQVNNEVISNLTVQLIEKEYV